MKTLFLLILLTSVAYAQKRVPASIENPEIAKDFLLVFLSDVESRTEGLSLIYISNLSDTSEITITCKEYPMIDIRFQMKPYSDTIIKFGWLSTPGIELAVHESEVVSGKVVRVRSSSPVVCIGSSGYSNFRDQYAAVSEDQAGTSFRVLTYLSTIQANQVPTTPHLCIAAFYHNTEVTIIPTEVTEKGAPKGMPLQFTIDSGECVYIRSEGVKENKRDLSGTTVTSTKPVVVYSGHPNVDVPYWIFQNPNHPNYIIESMPPLKSLGKGYVFQSSLQKRGTYDWNKSELVRVLAVTSGTQVYVNDIPWGESLNEGDYRDTLISGTALFKANTPFMIASYSASSEPAPPDSSCGPFLATLPSLESLATDQTFYVCPDTLFYDLDTSKYYTVQYVQVVVERSNKSNVQLDGNTIADSIFIDVPGVFEGKRFSAGSIRTSPGTQHRLTVPGKAENGFVFLVYGASKGERQMGYAYGSQMLYRKKDPLTVIKDDQRRKNKLVASIKPISGSMLLHMTEDINGKALIEVFDLLGNTQFSEEAYLNGKENEIELYGIPITSGVYIVRMKHQGGDLISKLVVLQ